MGILLKRIYKYLLKELCWQTGSFKKIKNYPEKHAFPCFIFHRISGSGIKDLAPDLYTINNRLFLKIISRLHKHYDFLSFDDLARQIYHEKKAMITFDDGYRSSFDNVLREFGVMPFPYMYFLVSSFVIDGRPLWYDIIEHIIFNSKRGFSFNLGANRFDISTTSLLAKRSSTDALIKYIYSSIPGPGIMGEIFRLSESAGVEIDEKNIIGVPYYAPVDRQTLLKHMEKGHIQIGSHTVNHWNLSICRSDTIYEELNNSKLSLEQHCSCECSALSIPGGSFNEKVIKLAKEIGYKYIFTSSPHDNDYKNNIYGRSVVLNYMVPADVLIAASKIIGINI